jgi:xanthine dehydrogenase small subunit
VEQQDTATVVVNGRPLAVRGTAVHSTALDWLRDHGLTGAKEGCAEGECGACSILVRAPGIDTASEWVALNSCLVPVAALDGQELVTAEGLGTSRALHPVQREMAVAGGSQCGYCTPGFVCSMAAEYYRPGGPGGSPTGSRRRRAPAEDQDDHGEHGPNGFDLHALSGNLCRCTGYRPIRDAPSPSSSPPTTTRSRGGVQHRRRRAGDEAGERDRGVRAAGSSREALALLARRPEAVLLAGSTDLGVAVNLLGVRAPLVVAIDRLPELRDLRIADEQVEIGAALSLTEVERRLAGRVPLLRALFPQFASRLIRNAATFGGNLGTGSPIGDAAPVLLALDAALVLTSATASGRSPWPSTSPATGRACGGATS